MLLIVMKPPAEQRSMDLEDVAAVSEIRILLCAEKKGGHKCETCPHCTAGRQLQGSRCELTTFRCL